MESVPTVTVPGIWHLNFRSYADLAEVIQRNLWKIPKDVDLVVGVPRSGLLPALQISLALNVPCTDVEGFISKRIFGYGRTRGLKNAGCEIKHALVVDDTVASGETLSAVHARLEAEGLFKQLKITYLAVYVTNEDPQLISLEVLPHTRLFQWNIFHHKVLNWAGLDMDGILCKDPTNEERQDEEKYRAFLDNTPPLVLPTHTIKAVVSGREERWEEQTRRWLDKWGVKYGNLYLRPAGAKIPVFKAETIYSKGLYIFVESEAWQAKIIGELVRRPTLCTENWKVYGDERG